MPFPIEKKLVVGVSSTALFNLEIEETIFDIDGLEKFKEYQKEHAKTVLKKGLAFPFIKRFLNINSVYPDEKPAEVVLFSKNSPETIFQKMESKKKASDPSYNTTLYFNYDTYFPF